MSKTLTLFLATTPCSGENTHTALRLAEDLAMWGFGREALAAGCGPVDYGAVVDTLLADGRAVLGAF